MDYTIEKYIIQSTTTLSEEDTKRVSRYISDSINIDRLADLFGTPPEPTTWPPKQPPSKVLDFTCLS